MRIFSCLVTLIIPDVDWNSFTFPPGGYHPAVNKIMINIAISRHLSQFVRDPTRGKNILDLCFTNCDQLVEKTSISAGISDHNIITVLMSLKLPRLCKPSRRVFIYSMADFKAISSSLDSFYAKLASRPGSDCGASKLWSDFKDTIFDAMDDLIPTKTTSTKVHLPWLDNSIKRSIRKKQRLYNKTKRSKGDKN